MKVFLVNPSSRLHSRAGAYSESMLPVPPLGLAYIAASAQSAGHHVAVEDQYASQLPVAALIDRIKRFRADVVGLGCLSPNMPVVERIVKELNAQMPKVHITLGNIHATVFAKELLERLPIDSIVMGEGEAVFKDLLYRLDKDADLTGIKGLAYKKAQEVIINAPRQPVDNLDALPRPAWDLFRLDDYQCPPRLLLKGRILPVQSTRGCSYHCTFCSQNALMPGVRKRKIENVVDEIQWLHSAFGITNFGFQDAAFPFTEKEGLRLCRLLIERKLHRKMKWFSQTRCDMVSFELLKEMKRAGCVFVMYGFESGSNRHLRASRKNFSVQKALETAKWMKELRFHAYGLFMIGFPDETLAEARQTIALAKQLDCIVASFARVTPYPGSSLYTQYEDTFPENVFPWQWNSQFRWEEGQPDWQLPGLSSRQINRLIKNAMISYYIRPSLIIRHVVHGMLSPRMMVKGCAAMVRELYSR